MLVYSKTWNRTMVMMRGVVRQASRQEMTRGRVSPAGLAVFVLDLAEGRLDRIVFGSPNFIKARRN